MHRCRTLVSEVLFALTIIGAVDAQEPAILPLRLVESGSHDVLFEKDDAGNYTITTRGDDPYALTVPLSQAYDHERLRVIAFELLCPAGLDFIQVFYGLPRESHSTSSWHIAPADTWVPVAIPLRRNWDMPYRVFRLDFGGRGGVTLQLRGLVLRPLADGEKEADQRWLNAVKEDAEQGRAISSYLGREWPGRVDTVSVDRRFVRISGVAPEAGTSLVEVPLHAPMPSCTEAVSVTTLSVRGNFQVEVPRFVADREGVAQDRLFARWRLARFIDQRLEGLSAAVWATDTDEAADTRLPRAMPSSKKGLADVDWFPEAQEDLPLLGCRNLTVEILLPSILDLAPGGDGTTPYTFNGKQYAANEKALEPLDNTMRLAREHGIVVSAVILIPRPLADRNAQRVWCHPDASAPGRFALANVTTPEGVDAYAAALDLLARRYGSNTPTYGRIANWIIHHEVDKGLIWANAGEKSMVAYLELYYRALRIAHYTVRRHDPAARVFIPLSHYWTAMDPGSYSPRAVLELLQSICGREGDFEWGVAYHPYPQDVCNPAAWLDTKATFSFDTPLITMRNIEVLDAWMKRPEFRFNGAVRGVLLSEQGCNTADLSEANQRLQAAGIVYFWHKIRDLESIEALLYHRWIDDAGDSGLRFGLRSAAPGTSSAPGERKLAWTVFRALGTPEENAATEFAKALIGVQDFSQIRYLGPLR
jgi:hypothetical protein